MQIKGGKFDLDGALQVSAMSGDPQKPKNVAIIGKDCSAIDTADRFVIF